MESHGGEDGKELEEGSEKTVDSLQNSDLTASVLQKRITRHPEDDSLSTLSDEVPVKRVRFDGTIKDEASTSKDLETDLDSNLSKNTGATIVKTIQPRLKSYHEVKWVELKGENIPIVTQNENGPCPLIAIVNVLLLRKKISLKDRIAVISADDLVEHVRSALKNMLPKNSEEYNNPNYMQNVQDAYGVINQLQTGLDVNVKFTGVKYFEYTPECIIFDLLDIQLYHGWLMDPQSSEIVAAVGNLSYNQLVEMIINKKTSIDKEDQTQAEIAEQFLETTATQLTSHGLSELNKSLEKGKMAVLFRNNHFSVIYKNEDTLCQLVTDQGYLNEKRVVWETLTSIYGDESFLDGNFRNMLPKSMGAASSDQVIEDQQISQDFLMALSLQDEQNKQQDKEFDWEAYGNAHGAIGMTSDEEIARRLFIEEQRMAQASGVRSTVDVQPDGEHPTPPPTTSSQSQGSKPKEPEESSKAWRCSIS